MRRSLWRCSLLLLVVAVLLPAQERRFRVAVGRASAESNSFYPAKPPLIERKYASREAWLQEAARGGVPGGIIEASKSLPLDLYPVYHAGASSLGTVSRESFEQSTTELVRQIKDASPRFDGVFLTLHGAMVVEGFPHGDAEVVRRVREAMGKDFPIVVTHDYHANVSQEIVDNSSVLITYKEHPHLDTRDRGAQAARIMARILKGEVKPVQALAKPPVLFNLINHNTFRGPLKPVTDETKRLEAKDSKILAVSVCGGYQWADVPFMGPSVIVVTNNDPALAKREAQRLSEMVYALRDKLTEFTPPDTATAVRMAIANQKFPVALMDTGDNIGGGSAGDGTYILQELLKQKAQGWVMSISDPAAVKAAVQAGPGQPFDMAVGGKTDKMHGEPTRIRGTVRSISVGSPGRGDGGTGLTAVIEAEGSTRDLQNFLVLTSRPSGARSVEELIRNGIQPAQQRILVSKGTVAPHASYDPVSALVLEVNSPGPTDVNPKRFTYKNVRRPIYGLP